jgi:nucleoside-diphosphate-sugar epimerase
VRVLVTGSSSCLARALLPRLCAGGDITEVTGVDLRPAHFAHPKFRALVMDFRDPQTTALLPAILMARIAGSHMRPRSTT